MKTKILLAVLMILALGAGSCTPDVYPHHYPPTYRTYQDYDHGGMDTEHGGGHNYYGR